MAPDPTSERREGALTANRLRQLAETPLRGGFDLDHLKAIHATIFQDLPHHHPGEMRGDTSGWSKLRVLEGQAGGHEVHYAHNDIARRAQAVLRELAGPAALAGLPPDAVAARMARLYGDLDFVHPFQEGNSRTLREFTRSLALAAGYELDWTATNVDAAYRNRLYIARDIAVLERAFPGLTPQRGMETNDRAEYETSIVLSRLRRLPGASLDAIICERLTPIRGVRQEAVPQDVAPNAPQATRSLGVAGMALAALARQQSAAAPAAPVAHTSIADRLPNMPPVAPEPPASRQPRSKPAPAGDAAPADRSSSHDPSP